MDIEQMRLRMGEMAAEIERLQSIIDTRPSPAVAVPDGLRELIAACRQIGFPVVTDGMRYVIDDMQSALSRVQNSIGVPSPRITDQDDIGAQLYEEMQDAMHPHVVNGLLPWSVIESWELIFAHWLATKDGRITEKDAGEILLSYGVEYIGILQWLKDKGRSTLAKLNEVSHETN